MKKILCVLSAVAVALSLVGCGTSAKIITQPEFPSDYEAENPDNFTGAENEGFSLLWNAGKKRVELYDKAHNASWTYVPRQADKTRYDAEGYEIMNHPQIQSPVSISYVNKKDYLTHTAIGYTASVKSGDFAAEKLRDGIRVVYFFPNESISVTVDYRLAKDHLEISVDPKLITEDLNLVTEISIAPFFCSVENATEDSYLFMPSGSGCLIDADVETDDVQIIREQVYGGDIFTPNDNVLKTNTETVRLPVFGAKSGGSAVCGIITSGAAQTQICANVGNRNIGYSAVYPVIEVRKGEVMQTNGGSQLRTVYAKGTASEKVTVAYYPLYAEEADYSGMARCYRNYLEEKYSIKSDCTQSPINLEIIGGTEVTKSVLGIPHTSVTAVTDLEKTESIIDEITEKTEALPAVRLLGYGGSGIDIGKIAGGLTVSKAVGGEKRLRETALKYRELNIPLFFDFNAVQFKTGSSLASVRSDSALITNGKRAIMHSYYLWSGTRDLTGSSFYFLKREQLPKVMMEISKAAQKLNLSGISLETVSENAYSDYSSRKYFSKGNTEADMIRILKAFDGKKLQVAGCSSNEYFAACSDYIFEAPDCSSLYDVYSRDVPFYQMVFKGVVPISGKPVNLANDSAECFLKSVETGIGLTYMLCGDIGRDIIFSDDSRFYGSAYSSVKEDILSAAEKTRDYYSAVSDSRIISHRAVIDSLNETVFENGVTVYVNYGEDEVVTPIGRVAGKSFVYAGKGERK